MPLSGVHRAIVFFGAGRANNGLMEGRPNNGVVVPVLGLCETMSPTTSNLPPLLVHDLEATVPISARSVRMNRMATKSTNQVNNKVRQEFTFPSLQLVPLSRDSGGAGRDDLT